MAERFQFFPENPSNTSIQTWGDRQVRLRMTYRERMSAWYMDLFDADGVALAVGRRVSPSYAPLLGLGLEGFNLPRGRFLIFVGPVDPYAKEALSDTLDGILLTQEEVDAAQSDTGTFETTIVLG